MDFNAIAIASDHRGYWLKKGIIERFKDLGYNTTDYGTENDCVSVDYPDYAKKVCEHVLQRENTFGILICYTGIGMDITANRHRGIRAVRCDREETARFAREQNDANVICFGSRSISSEYAIRYSEVFAKTPFAGKEYWERIKKIDE